jgi:hypothetical protein
MSGAIETELHNVVQFFIDDSYEYVVRAVGPEEAMETVKRLMRSVGGRLGTTKRIIITDMDDFTNFDWIHGEGIVFPPMSK